jgi:hypothetical protein
MKRLLCLIGIHDFGKWLYVKPIGRYEHKLMRKCSRCSKTETYTGLTETNKMTGEQSPYKN